MLPFAYFGIESSGLSTFIDLLIVFVVVVYLALIYWTYMDARRRIEDPMLIGCAVAASLFPFVGTVVYAILRPPEYLEDVRERELEIRAAQARLYELDHGLCPHCDYRVERDFIRCPSCLRKLKERCASCGRPLERAWSICPYCEAEVLEAAPLRRRRHQRGRVEERRSELGALESSALDGSAPASSALDGSVPANSVLGGARLDSPGLESRALDSPALDGPVLESSPLGGAAPDGSSLERPASLDSTLEGSSPRERAVGLDGGAQFAAGPAPVLRDDRRDERSHRQAPAISSAGSAGSEDEGTRPAPSPDQMPPRPRGGRARYPRSGS